MIDTDALRSKVLVLAMHGKLSERIESDSSSDDLYHAIIEEKERLVNAGLIRKDGKLEDAEAEYEIPDTWKWVKFGKIITLQSGQDLAGTEYNSDGNGIPYMTGASNFCDNGTLLVNRWTDVPKAYARRGDILISCKGTVGKIAILDEDVVHIARQIMGIKVYQFNTDFAKYFVESGIDKIKAASKGLIPGIERNDILNLNCPLPPLEEQSRIVRRISEVFVLLDTIDALQLQYASDIEMLKSKLIDAGIQGKLTEQLPEDGNAQDLYDAIQADRIKSIKEKKIKKEMPLEDIAENEIPFEIPNNWKWVRLSSISKRIWAGGDKPDDFVNKRDELHLVPVVANGVTDEGILGYTAKSKASKDTITIAGRGTIGFCIYRNYDYCPIVRLLVVEPEDKISAEFLMYVMKSMPASSVGSSIPQLTVPMIAPKLIPLPPYDEQLRIVKHIKKIMNAIS